MKNKGFTLIELLVSITVIGVISVIALPQITQYSIKNSNKKFSAYEKALASATRVYVNTYSEDLFGYNNTGCALVTYEDLKNKKLIDDIQEKDVDCGATDTYVYVRKNSKGKYGYEIHVVCRNNEKIVYGTSTPPNNSMCTLNGQISQNR